MSALRPALRIARRELLRRKGRTLLVILMVAVPVAAFIVGTTVARTASPPLDVVARNAMGGADAIWTDYRSSALTEGGAPAAAEAYAARVGDVVPDATSATVTSAAGTVAGPDGDVPMTVLAGPMAGPLLSPRYDLVDGRLPTSEGEVALTPELASALHAVVGGELNLPELAFRARVVGIADRVLWSNASEVLTTKLPDLEPSTVDSQVLIDLPAGHEADAVAALSAIDVGASGSLGLGPTSAGLAGVSHVWAVRGGSDVDSAVRGSFVGEALAFAVLGLLISVAFTIGARRQVRMLGLVAANGGSPAMVRAVVVAQGFWCGVAGAVLGLVLAFGGLSAGWPIASDYLNYHPGWWTVSVMDAVIISLIGVGAAVGSSWLPARTVSRQGVLQALAGRRPLPALRPRLAVAGAALAGGGLGLLALTTVLGATARSSRGTIILSAMAIAGGLAVLAGTVIGAHGLVALVGRFGSRAGGSMRLAARSLARQRTRYGSVVAGVAALTAGALLIAGSMEPGRVRPVGVVNPTTASVLPPDNQVTVTLAAPVPGPSLDGAALDRLEPVKDVLPDAELFPLQTLQFALDTGGGLGSYANQRPAALATPEVVEQLELPIEVRRALTDQGIVGFAADDVLSHQDPLTGATVQSVPTVRMFNQGNVGGPVDVAWFPPAAAGTQAATYNYLGTTFLVTGERLAALGIPEPPIDVVQVVNPTKISDDQRAALDAMRPHSGRFWLRGGPNPSDSGIFVSVPFLPSNAIAGTSVGFDPDRLVELSIAGASLLLTALVVALGVALAAADSREERDALQALGAPPAMMRRAEGFKAAIVAALGAAVALVAAGLPAMVVALADRWSHLDRVPFATGALDESGWTRYIPWTTIAWVAIGIPVVLGLATMLGSGLRARWRPVAASQFSFD